MSTGEEKNHRATRDFAIYLLDTRGRVVGWPSVSKAREEREKGPWHFSRFYAPDARAAGEPERDLLLAFTGPVEVDAWRTREDGSRLWAHVVLSPFEDQLGRMLGFVLIMSAAADRTEGQGDSSADVAFPPKFDRRRR
jgi:hypothetical protein